MNKCGICGNGLSKDCPENHFSEFKQEIKCLSQSNYDEREDADKKLGAGNVTNRKQRRAMKAGKK